MAYTIVSRYSLDNVYTDSVGSNTMVEGGTGNSFVTSPVKKGTHSLQLDGNGWALVTGDTGIPTGNNDIFMAAFVQWDAAAGSHGVAGLGVSSANANQNLWFFKTSGTNIRVDQGSDTLNFTVPSMSTDTWYWVFLQYTASDKSSLIYLDNVASSSGLQAHGANLNLAASTNMIIGADIDTNVKLPGNLDDVIFGTGAPSAQERADLMATSAAARGHFALII